jgi:hypothetical protein
MATPGSPEAKAQKDASPYYIGERKIQAGKKKGIAEIGLILISEKIATKIALPLVSGLPKTVGGTQYQMKNRAVFAQGTRQNGERTVTFTRLVRVKRGSKAVKLYLSTSETYSYKQQGVAVTGRRPQSVQVGVPAWVSAAQVHDFFAKATNVVSFSFGGGIYPILRGAA